MCEVSGGYQNICDETGGVDLWYWFALKDASGASNIATSTVVAGAVTALTLEAGKFAYPIIVEMETSTFTDSAIGERANKAYAREQVATIVEHGNTAAMIVQLEAAAKSRVCLIARIAGDESYEILFLNNGGKTVDVRTPGTAYEDGNMNTLTISGKEKNKAPKISEAIVLALLAP
jgi:hypothetical protein